MLLYDILTERKDSNGHTPSLIKSYTSKRSINRSMHKQQGRLEEINVRAPPTRGFAGRLGGFAVCRQQDGSLMNHLVPCYCRIRKLINRKSTRSRNGELLLYLSRRRRQGVVWHKGMRGAKERNETSERKCVLESLHTLLYSVALECRRDDFVCVFLFLVLPNV